MRALTTRVRALAPYLPFALLGPFTGLLIALALRAARRGDWLVALMLTCGVVEFWLLGPALLTYSIPTGLHNLHIILGVDNFRLGS